MKLDPSILAIQDPARVGQTAMHILNVIQHTRRPELQACAMAVAFVALCRKLRVHPGDVMQAANNILNGDQRFYLEIRALQDYIEGEIVNGKALVR